MTRGTPEQMLAEAQGIARELGITVHTITTFTQLPHGWRIDVLNQGKSFEGATILDVMVKAGIVPESWVKQGNEDG